MLYRNTAIQDEFLLRFEKEHRGLQLDRARYVAKNCKLIQAILMHPVIKKIIQSDGEILATGAFILITLSQIIHCRIIRSTTTSHLHDHRLMSCHYRLDNTTSLEKPCNQFSPQPAQGLLLMQHSDGMSIIPTPLTRMSHNFAAALQHSASYTWRNFTFNADRWFYLAVFYTTA